MYHDNSLFSHGGETGYSYAKNPVGPVLIWHAILTKKKKSRCKCKSPNYTIAEKNTGINLSNLGLGKIFLNMLPKYKWWK